MNSGTSKQSTKHWPSDPVSIAKVFQKHQKTLEQLWKIICLHLGFFEYIGRSAHLVLEFWILKLWKFEKLKTVHLRFGTWNLKIWKSDMWNWKFQNDTWGNFNYEIHGYPNLIRLCEDGDWEMMKNGSIKSQKSWIWISYLSENTKWEFGKSYKLFNFQVRKSPAPLNIPTPTPAPERVLSSKEVWESILKWDTMFWHCHKVSHSWSNWL